MRLYLEWKSLDMEMDISILMITITEKLSNNIYQIN